MTSMTKTRPSLLAIPAIPAIIVALALGAAGCGRNSGGPNSDASTFVSLPSSGGEPGAADSTPSATAEITEQTLVDRESHDGTLAHGDSTTISSRGSGTITALPAEGSTVSRGKAIFRLDDAPVTLLSGSLPAYRTLKTGVKGDDVKEFEENLWALGYRGFRPDTDTTGRPPMRSRSGRASSGSVRRARWSRPRSCTPTARSGWTR